MYYVKSSSNEGEEKEYMSEMEKMTSNDDTLRDIIKKKDSEIRTVPIALVNECIVNLYL
jgi:hypothetical protein